jgi:hypothetical protein
MLSHKDFSLRFIRWVQISSMDSARSTRTSSTPLACSDGRSCKIDLSIYREQCYRLNIGSARLHELENGKQCALLPARLDSVMYGPTFCIRLVILMVVPTRRTTLVSRSVVRSRLRKEGAPLSFPPWPSHLLVHLLPSNNHASYPPRHPSSIPPLSLRCQASTNDGRPHHSALPFPRQRTGQSRSFLPPRPDATVVPYSVFRVNSKNLSLPHPVGLITFRFLFLVRHASPLRSSN